MLTIRKSEDRGRFDHGWLDTRHTFSFADYFHPRHVHFRTLRVINEDWVAPGEGFGTHPHRDMEIVTIVLEGSLRHRDSMGTGSVIRPGEVQRMTAGSGVTHSEVNASDSERVHLYQIWILPERKGLEPSYEQKAFPASERRNRLRVVASRDGRDGSVTIHQDASVHVATLDAGVAVTHELGKDRAAWVQVVRGDVTVDGRAATEGDGVAVEDQRSVTLKAVSDAEVILFDLL